MRPHRAGIYDETLADGNIWMETRTLRMVRRLAREEACLVFLGCNVHAATMIAREAERDEPPPSSRCSATAPKNTERTLLGR